MKVIRLNDHKTRPEEIRICYLRGLLPRKRGTEIFTNEIIEIIKRELGDRDFTLILADERYWLVNHDEILAFLVKNRIDKLVWRKNLSDCDDFAKALIGALATHFWGRATSFGELWFWDRKLDYVHAVVFFINERKDLLCIEPQTDAVMRFRYADWVPLLVKL